MMCRTRIWYIHVCRFSQHDLSDTIWSARQNCIEFLVHETAYVYNFSRNILKINIVQEKLVPTFITDSPMQMSVVEINVHRADRFYAVYILSYYILE